MSSANVPDWTKTRDRILATVGNPHNRSKLLEYLDERQAGDMKPGTLANEANAMRDFCLFLGDRPLESVARPDVTSFVNQSSRVRIWRNLDRDGKETLTKKSVALSRSTLNSRKVIVKCFFKWLRQTEDYPQEVRHIKGSRPQADSIPTDELVTRQDLQALLQAHPDRRDKALIAFLYESGFRAGEVCALNVGSVEFLPQFAQVTLPKGAPGLKTGARTIIIFDSRPFLQDWWENHPFKDDRSKPLFHSLSRRAPMVRMTNGALHGFVKKAGERAGIKKHLHPHLFRHSAATERVRLGWTEAHMRDFFGWTRSSDMPSHYVHLAGSDYQRMEMERRGLVADGDTARPALTGLLCPGCKHSNLLTAAFCQSCSRPISPRALEDAKTKQQEDFREVAARMLATMMKDQIAEEVRRAVRPA